MARAARFGLSVFLYQSIVSCMVPISAKMRFRYLLVLAIVGASSGVGAQEAGDSQAGLTLARRNCAECHAVEKGRAPSLKPDAPTFEAIAAVPGMTTAALLSSLHTSHPDRTMPLLILSATDLRHIVAYIQSLK